MIGAEALMPVGTLDTTLIRESPMKHVLLLGAGFSHNWGGWLASEAFEYLLGCREIQVDQTLKDLMWKHQDTGGFEGAIEQVQKDHTLFANAETASRLQGLQAAVSRMFADMNKAFIGLKSHDWEFCTENYDKPYERRISTFLGKFDAIFSLNQDVLIERQYHGDDRAFTHHPIFSQGPSLPGMQHHSQSGRPGRSGWSQDVWTPMSVPELGFSVEPNTQPFFKLHGSSNWRRSSGDDLLIIGGNKLGAIKFNPVLNWYHEMFERYLCMRDTRLMVIGYGFRDLHINEVIRKGVETGAEFFVVDPRGSSLAAAIGRQPVSSVQGPPTDLEETFKKGLIGASRRSLRSIFSDNDVEFGKVQSFFN